MNNRNYRPDWSSVSSNSEVTKIYWAQWDSLVLKNDILYRKWESSDGKEIRLLLILPKSLREEVLQSVTRERGTLEINIYFFIKCYILTS